MVFFLTTELHPVTVRLKVVISIDIQRYVVKYDICSAEGYQGLTVNKS
jgi:hypothetical protein